MTPILTAIAVLDDRVVARMDDLTRAQRRAASLAQAHVTSTAAVADLRARRAALARDDAGEQTQLAQFQHQRAMAIRSLETGIGSYATAEKQLAACDLEIDRLETSLLLRMDDAAALDTSLAAAVAAEAAALAAKQAAATDDGPRVAAWTADLEAARQEREALAMTLPAGERSSWVQLMRRRDTSTAWLARDASCHACHRDVPREMGPRIIKGELHTCAGCGRWIVKKPD